MNEHTAEIVTEMHLEKTPEMDHPFFTGWKEVMVDYYSNPPVGSGEYVGQIVQYIQADKRFAYVNLPGMQAGIGDIGSCFSIGAERVTEPPTPEVFREMLKKGLARLREMMEQYKANAQA